MSTAPLRAGARRRAMAEINVVPYIDVMLVLLVIFMVTAPLVATSNLDLPSVGNIASAQQTPPVIVNIDARGQLSVRYQEGGRAREQTLSQAELGLFVQQRQQSAPDQPMVIAADKGVKYETVMAVMSDLKARHVKRVGLLVKSR